MHRVVAAAGDAEVVVKPARGEQIELLLPHLLGDAALTDELVEREPDPNGDRVPDVVADRLADLER